MSIAVCSAAFIALSYMVSTVTRELESYDKEERYNLRIDFETEKTYGQVQKDMKSFPLAEEVLITRHTYIHVDDPKMTDKFEDILEKKGYGTDDAAFTLLVLDDESFENYASECGQKDAEGKAILVDSTEMILLQKEKRYLY